MLKLGSEKPKNFLKNKVILICDPFHTINALIKKIISEYGASLLNIHTTQSLSQAIKTLNSVSPHYIFSFHRDKDQQTCEELYLEHVQLMPNRSEAFFFLLINQKNAYYASAFKRYHSINGASFSPFSLNSLKESILKSPPPLPGNNSFYSELINKGRTLKNLKNYTEALACFEMAETKADRDPSDSLFYQGLCYFKLNKKEKAIEKWYSALDYCLHHAKALQKLFLYHHKKNEYEKAYRIQTTLLKNHPLDPALIPHFILISVRMKKYGEIYDLALKFQNLEFKAKETEKSIAAGLVMSGRYFVTNKKEALGRKLLLKASEVAEPNIDIFKNISLGLLSGGFFADAYELIAKMADGNHQQNQFKILEIDLLMKANELPKALTQGMELLEKEVYDPSLFHNMILASIKIGRNKKMIIKMINTASGMFPNNAKKYQLLKSHYLTSDDSVILGVLKSHDKKGVKGFS